jgi:hypothetical protein
MRMQSCVLPPFGSPDTKLAYTPVTGAPVAPPFQKRAPVAPQTQAPSVVPSLPPSQASTVPERPATNWFSVALSIVARLQPAPRCWQAVLLALWLVALALSA